MTTKKDILLSFIAIFTTLALGGGPFFDAQASANVNLDFQIFAIRNVTQNQSLPSQSIEARAGDEIEFSINLRNFSDFTAYNGQLAVYLPTGLTVINNSMIINGIQGGSNVAQNIFLGDLAANGQSNVTFRVRIANNQEGTRNIGGQVWASNANPANRNVLLEIYPSVNGASTSPLPSISPTPSPSPSPVNGPFLGISVLGKNLTKNDPSWLKTVQAEPADLIRFSIMLTSTGQTVVKNIYLKDFVDVEFMTFVPDTVTINGLAASDNLVTSELSLGNMTPGQVTFVKLEARVAGPSKFSQPQIILANRAQVRGDNIALANNAASVSVTNPLLRSQSSANSAGLSSQTGSSPNAPNQEKTRIVYLEKETLDLLKLARNISQEQKTASEQINARPGDELEFTIQITSTSTRAIRGLVVKDLLPAELDFIFNSSRMEEKAVGDEIVRQGLAIGNLNPQETKIITYRARVIPQDQWPDQEKEKITNEVRITSVNAATISGVAEIFIDQTALNFLGGTIFFGNFTVILIIFLVALIILLLSFLLREKKRNGRKLPISL